MFSALPHQWRNSSAKLRQKNQEPKTLFKLLTFFCFCTAPRLGLPGLTSRKRVQSYALVSNLPNFSVRKYAIKHIFNIRSQIIHPANSPPQAHNTLICRSIGHKNPPIPPKHRPRGKKNAARPRPSEKNTPPSKKTPTPPNSPALPFNFP